MRIALITLLLSIAVITRADAIDDFTRKAEFTGARISPDGKYLAVSRRVDNRIGLMILDLADMSVAGIISGDKDEQVHSVGWVSNERLALQMSFVSLDNSGARTYGEVYTAKYDGTQTHIVYGFRGGSSRIGSLASWDDPNIEWADILDFWETEPDRIVIATTKPYGPGAKDPRRSTIRHFNVATRETGLDVTAPLGGCVIGVDEAGTPRFCSGVNVDYDDETHYYVDWETGWVEIPHHDVTLVRWAPGATSGLALARVRGSDRVGLYRFDASDRSFEAQYVDDRYDLHARDLLYGIGGTTFGIEVGGHHDRYIYFDADDPQVAWHESLRETFPGQRVRFLDTTADGRLVVVHVSSATNPGEFYLFDTINTSISLLLRARDWIDNASLVPTRLYQVPASDGPLMDVYLTARPGTGKPLIVMPHGGPHARDRLGFDPTVQLLASAGYAVMQVNFRGSTGYGKDFETAAYGEWGGAVQRDIAEATEWAMKQEAVDPQRVCIFGISFGAYSAVMNVIQRPDLYRCAVAMSGLYDFGTQMRASDTSESRTGRSFLRRSFADDRELADAHSPVNHVDKLEVPVLVAHGHADERTPIAHARKLRKALRRHGVPHEWMTWRNEGHGIWFDENQREFFEAMLAFLNDHIPAEAER